YIVQQLKFSLGQAPDKVDRMQRFKEWYLVDRSKDNTENTAIPNYSFVRAHDASVQEDILQLIQDTTGKPWGVYTNEELQQGLKDYMADQKLTNKKYNRYNIPSSYAILLTNKDTIPRVYYGDLYSDAGKYMAEKSIYFDAIDNLLKTRTKYVAGGQTLDVDGHDI
ncbi:glycoside hydrolase family 70 protein, partial [Ligilactobacillus animalis]